MWDKLSSVILRYRTLFLVIIGIATIFMGYEATKVEMSYEATQLLPQKDSSYVDNQNFIKTFGEEGNLIVVAITDSNFFDIDHFNKWKKLCNDLRKVGGVENMISAPNSVQLVKNIEERKFEIKQIFPDTITSQEELDSLANIFKSTPIYRNYLYSDSANAFLVALTMNKDKMRTREREALVKEIKSICSDFEEQNNIELHYSGLPYIRVVNTIKMKREIFLFTGIALVICLVILFLFFKSFKATIIPAGVVLIGVVFALGFMSILGYQITIFTAMIPPLMIVIGIPNSIYMLNKFHNEYRVHGNKMKALKRVIQKIGNSILLTNLTTACGFATFIITSSKFLREFGIVASIDIIVLFLLSIFLVPIIFSFVPSPQRRHIKHLDRKGISKVIEKLILITQKYRRWVYTVTIVCIAISIFGISKMHTTGYIVDDLPKDDAICVDLHYFESNFDGLMPLEIMIDTKKPNGVMQASTLKKMDMLDKKLSSYDELSSSISVVSVVKMAKQAFYNGAPNYYSLPSATERNFIMPYFLGESSGVNVGMAHSFIDSSMQVTRMSIRAKDVGTKRMEELYAKFTADINEIFPKDEYNVTAAGSSVMTFKGNQYLLIGLFESLALAIVLISLFMASMFRSPRMVLLSLVPNILPLIFTAAIMGFTNIPIKSSTILVFSIAFGISVDNTIHFLAKYRQELSASNWNIHESVYHALRETGVSMIYTFTVLFFGFGVFALSSFGSTQALGILVSLTLTIALAANLILLPSLLIGFEKIVTTESFYDPNFEIFDTDEDIDIDELEIDKHENEQIDDTSKKE